MIKVPSRPVSMLIRRHIRSTVNNKHYKTHLLSCIEFESSPVGRRLDFVQTWPLISPPPLLCSEHKSFFYYPDSSVRSWPHFPIAASSMFDAFLVDYCNTLCTYFDVITMCNLLPGWNWMEQWLDRSKRRRRQLMSNASVSLRIFGRHGNQVLCVLLSSWWIIDITALNKCTILY